MILVGFFAESMRLKKLPLFLYGNMPPATISRLEATLLSVVVVVVMVLEMTLLGCLVVLTVDLVSLSNKPGIGVSFKARITSSSSSISACSDEQLEDEPHCFRKGEAVVGY